MRYGMVIDLNRCCGCDACAVACKQVHGTEPGVYWTKVVKGEEGSYPNVRLTFLPTQCSHCAEAPCAQVCPTGATVMNENGVVLVDPDLCIGCRYCMAACPFDARSLTMGESYYGKDGATELEKSIYKEGRVGTVSKCRFCDDRLAEGKMPACVQTCPSKARFFGDLDDSDSEVSKILASKQSQVKRPELDLTQKIFYV